MFSIDLLADLPEPRDDEPSSLRSDIFDELADHLQCAFRREILTDGDAQAAQRRALDRFGDPKKLARRLWRQAMWSRIMRQRIVSALQWMVAFSAMLLAGAVFWQQSRMFAELRQARYEDAAQRQALAAKLDQFQHRAEAAVPVGQTADNVGNSPYFSAAASRVTSVDSLPPMNPPAGIDALPPVLTLKFVQETEDGPPVSPAGAMLSGSGGVNYGGEPSTGLVKIPPANSVPDGKAETNNIEGEDAIDNRIVFRSLEPDNYELMVELRDGRHGWRSVLIRDDNPRELTIVCPAPQKKAPVPIAIQPLPEALQQRNFSVSLVVSAAPIEIGQTKWNPNLPEQKILFDARTGSATAVGAGRSVDLRSVPADERRVFLPVGTVNYGFEASPPLAGPEGSTPVYTWPDSWTEEARLEYTVGADERPWQVELPKEYLERLLSEAQSPPYGYAPPKSYAPASGGAPAADDAPMEVEAPASAPRPSE